VSTLDSPKPLLQRETLPWFTLLGTLQLAISSGIYAFFGLTAYPRQEWLLEILVSVVFMLPALSLLKGNTTGKSAVRLIGIMLLFHSLWDTLHWPLLSVIDTPIDPRIPQICPYFDIPLGILLLVRGR
jgi:hypothetical protein